MKRTFKFLFLLLALVSCFALTSCKTKDANKVNLGVISPLTGNLSTYGTAVEKGVKLAVKEINAAGGIQIGDKKMEIALNVQDEKGDSVEAVTAYNRMYKNIDFLIGDVTSGNTEAVASKAAEFGTPMLTPTATAASVTTNRANVFRTCFLDPTQGETMAVFTKNNLKVTKVAVMYDQSDDYSKGVAEAYIAKAKSLGITITTSIDGLSDKSVYATLVERALASNPEAIFAPIYYEEAAVLATELHDDEAGKKIPLMGVDGFDGVLGQLTSDTSIANNTFFCNHYYVGDTEPVVANFVNAFKDEYNEVPNSFAALAYDSVYIMKKAMEDAGTLDQAAVVAALQNVSWTGVTGAITFNSNGDPVKALVVCEYDNTVKDGVKVNTKVTA